jgi:hypothetical protein
MMPLSGSKLRIVNTGMAVGARIMSARTEASVPMFPFGGQTHFAPLIPQLILSPLFRSGTILRSGCA